MKTFAAAIFFILFSFFPAAAQTENGGLRRLSDKEIDAQLRNMQDLLPVEIQSGIRWVDIKRSAGRSNIRTLSTSIPPNGVTANEWR